MHVIMNDENGCHINDNHLIGICLLGDGLSKTSFLSASTSSSSNVLKQEETVIGSMRCVNLDSSVDKFRLQLVTELPSIPPKFKFLCKNGWPIEQNLEYSLCLKYLINSDIVRIQRDFDVPRLGVKWFEGEFLGFIFINYNSNLAKTRETISMQLAEKVSSLGYSYEFRDNHGWPVMLNQEKELVLWDICDRNCVSICKVDRKAPVSSEKNHSPTHDKSPFKDKWTEGGEEDRVTPVRKKPKYPEEHQTIVISYVHGEASKHARDLKSELVNLGRKVFLDTDDIPGGRDWQDTLNKVVNDCVAFIALVTPSYGETRWTNREAKFADEKQKHIIPISFLNTWPPDQLAIQFFSLQYIPWKTVEELKLAKEMGNEQRAHDVRFWEQPCVHRVAKEIIKWLPEPNIGIQDTSTSTHFSYSVKPDSIKTSRKRAAYMSMQSDGFDLPIPDPEGCVEVVISAHPKQRDFADRIKKELKEVNIKVWCSFDMLDTLPMMVEDNASQNSDSQQSPIAPAPPCYPQSPLPNQHSEGSDESTPVAKRPQLLFSYSTEGVNTFSQEYFNSQELFTPDTPCGYSQMKQQFKHQTKKAKLVILIVSKDYCESCTCKQQAFYCERRKKVIAIKFGDFSLRCTLSNLYQEQNMLKGSNDCEFLSVLRRRVQQELHLNSGSLLNYEEKRIQKLLVPVKKKIRSETCIYIIGGTSFISSRTENISYALGTELAKMKNLTLATEGFFGVGDVVGRNFCEEREIKKEKPAGVFHIIPSRDDKDFSKIARQNEDGYFEKIPYGETIHCGSSVSERDSVASAFFKICILIEGGNRTSRLAEKFAWNDCIIIPIVSAEGATVDKYDLPSRMLKVPCGVSDCDWYKLQNPKAAAEDIAFTVKKIIKSLFKIREMKLSS